MSDLPPPDSGWGPPPAAPQPTNPPAAPPAAPSAGPSAGPSAAPPFSGPVGYTTPPPPVTTSTSGGFPKWIIAVALVAVAAIGIGVAVVISDGDDTTTDAPRDSSLTTVTAPSSTTPATGDQPSTSDTTAGTTAGTGDPAPTTVATAPPNANEVAGAPAGQRGTIGSPVPAGEIADIGAGWRLQVLDTIGDATALIAAENQFNDPPPPGSQFTLVRVALGYFGKDEPVSAFQPTISAVGTDHTELDNYCGVIPEEMPIFRDVFAGGVLVGNLCFITTAADVPVLKLYGVGDYFDGGGEVFLATGPTSAPPMAPLLGPRPDGAALDERTNATSLGTSAVVGEGWSIAVTGPARDITPAVLAENSFNEPPPDGYVFVGVDVTYSFAGGGSGSTFDVTAKAVGDGNVELDGNACGVVPGGLDPFADVFDGGTISGVLCFVVPAGQSITLYATASYDLAPVYFATA